MTFLHLNWGSSPKFSPETLKKIYLIIGILIIIGGLGFAGWFYRVPLVKMWNEGVGKVKGFGASLFASKTTADTKIIPVVSQVAPSNNTVVKNVPVVSVKDCGVGTAPDLKKPASYQNDAVLTCLGNSALNCEAATAILKDPLFPSIVRIVKNQENCNFKLSYADDSTLIDATGQKLAGRYVSCPISIVKAIDESKKVTAFNPPSTDNLGKYAGQIYFYGTLGLFMETNLDPNKIQSLGCSGPYIDSVITSFKKMQAKK